MCVVRLKELYTSLKKYLPLLYCLVAVRFKRVCVYIYIRKIKPVSMLSQGPIKMLVIYLGGSSEGSLKNRSAFCSDKLDEYLENEGKLMETSMGFSSSTPTSPVVYQLPTKSTSYVRTLDSVLKKQSTVIPSTSYTFKPASLSSTSRKARTQNRQTSSNSRGRSSYKPILPSPFPAKQKQNFSASVEKAAKSLSSSCLTNQADGFLMPNLDENILPKQISLRHTAQQQQAARPPGLSKSQVKLMDLEDCALWDGKPRTYITEERADISLATLLTAQVGSNTFLSFSTVAFSVICSS